MNSAADQGRRVGFARGGANMFGVELDMMADMGEGSKGRGCPPPLWKICAYIGGLDLKWCNI